MRFLVNWIKIGNTDASHREREVLVLVWFGLGGFGLLLDERWEREREREWWEVFSAGSEREGWSALIGWFSAVRSSWNLEGGGVGVEALFFNNGL